MVRQAKGEHKPAAENGAERGSETIYGRFTAAGYDWFMAGVEARVLRGHRRALLGCAAGRVLEIGGGTGANLPFYRTDIEELVVTEPEEPMARKLDENLRGYPLSARAVRAPAEDLPFDDGRFEVVVSTLVLCSVGELSSTLQEARQVLTSNGQLLFIEHVRSDDPALARWQDRLAPVWRWLGHGCRCNQDTVGAIQQSGFSLASLTKDQMRGLPRIVHPLVIGTAVKA